MAKIIGTPHCDICEAPLELPFRKIAVFLATQEEALAEKEIELSLCDQCHAIFFGPMIDRVLRRKEERAQEDGE